MLLLLLGLQPSKLLRLLLHSSAASSADLLCTPMLGIEADTSADALAQKAPQLLLKWCEGSLLLLKLSGAAAEAAAILAGT
jgi:hypothetical protein